MGTRTGLPVLHRAPPHHLEPGSSPRTVIAVPHRAPNKDFLMTNLKKILQVFMHYLF